MNASKHRVTASFAALLVFFFGLLATTAASAAAPQMLTSYRGPVNNGAAAAQAANRTPVQLNRAALFSLRPGDEAEFTLPNAMRHGFRLDLIQDHGDGIASWVGSHKVQGNAYRTIITTGPQGSFGSIQTPDGEFRLVPGGGYDVLIDMTAEQAVLPIISLSNDGIIPTHTKRRVDTGAPTTMTPIAGVNAVAVPKVTPTPQVVVDLLVVYSRGYAQKLGGALMTRLQNLIVKTNTTFADSEIAITMRLVNATQTNYPEGTDDRTALDAITPGAPGFDAASFGNIDTLRTQFGADMVVLLRAGADFGGNGAAWVTTSTPQANDMYSVASGCMAGCEWIFIHQLGHNMGERHDRPSAAWEAGGSPTYPQGAYPYSFGHYYCASGALSCNPTLPNGSGGGACPVSARPECSTQNAANFTTIMGEMHNSTTKVYKFSNPAITCSTGTGGSQPCGVASGPNSADNALSMNNNRMAVSAMRSTVVGVNQPGSLQFKAANYAGAEGTNLSFLVSRVGGSTGAVSVSYATSNGTATAGSDFTNTTGTLNWASGDVADKMITVPLINDGVTEGNETFMVNLSNATGPAGVYVGGPSSATAIITSPWPGASMPAGFVSTGSYAWSVGTDQMYEGANSLRSAQVVSPDTTNSTVVNSDLTYNGTFQAGTVAFAYQVSSFTNVGKFEFLVDDVVVFTDSGLRGWKLFSTQLTAGQHKLVWRFSNYLSTPCNSPTLDPPAPDGANCADRAWIDAVALPANTPAAPGAVRGDFNADRNSDLVWSNTDGRAAIWLMNGLTPTATSEIIGAGSGWSVIHNADFNADSRADIVWQHTDGRMAIYLMNGTTPTTTTQLLNAGTGWTVTHTPDLNGDGRADVLFRNTDGSIAVWLMNGTAVTGGSTIMGAASGWSVTHVADFNGDSMTDLLWRHTDGRVAIWLMNGTAVTATNQIMNAGSGWSVSHTGDLNGDGRADIVWRHTDGSVALWLMNGTAFVNGSTLLGAGTGWSVARAADFDGNGSSDLFFQHTDGRAAIYLMNGLTPTATAQIMNAGTGWTIKRSGDLNGDGRADIVWQNTNGSTAIWLMNGTTFLSGSQIMGTGTGWAVSTLGQ